MNWRKYKKWHFGCPNKNSEGTLISSTSPKSDRIGWFQVHFEKVYTLAPPGALFHNVNKAFFVYYVGIFRRRVLFASWEEPVVFRNMLQFLRIFVSVVSCKTWMYVIWGEMLFCGSWAAWYCVCPEIFLCFSCKISMYVFSGKCYCVVPEQKDIVYVLRFFVFFLKNFNVFIEM